MAYDEGLAERIRGVLEEERGVSEKKMFGGIAFLLGGRMFVGIAKGELMVRVGPARHREALAQRHVRPMDFTGRPMEGYVFVASEGISEDDQLAKWVRMGQSFVATLGDKRAPRKAAARKPAAKSKRRK